MSIVIDKNQPAHLFAADNTGAARGLIRRPGRYTHNPAGTKLAKRVAKGTLGINRRGW